MRWLNQTEVRLKEPECRLHKHTTEGYFSLHFFRHPNYTSGTLLKDNGIEGVRNLHI